MSYPIEPLLAAFAAHANRENAQAMSAYMRNLFPFYGLKQPERTLLLKAHLQAYGQPALDDLNDVIWDLWLLPERECHYTALYFSKRQLKKVPAETMSLIEQLIVTKSWWDTVDELINQAGTLFVRFPEIRSDYLPNWRTSNNIWLRRSAILFQRGYKNETDVALLFAIISENLGSDEFFINKAIGWALREYSKIDGPAIVDFVKNNDLEPLSEREAVKWLKGKGKMP